MKRSTNAKGSSLWSFAMMPIKAASGVREAGSFRIRGTVATTNTMNLPLDRVGGPSIGHQAPAQRIGDVDDLDGGPGAPLPAEELRDRRGHGDDQVVTTQIERADRTRPMRSDVQIALAHDFDRIRRGRVSIVRG